MLTALLEICDPQKFPPAARIDHWAAVLAQESLADMPHIDWGA